MSRCWTCGERHDSGYFFTCPNCVRTERAIKAQKTAAEQLNHQLYELVSEQQRTTEAIESLRDIFEWGFTTLSWELERQTKILSSASLR